MATVLVEGSNHQITRMFEEEGWEVTSSLEGADLVCFEGGADVTPSLYGEPNTCSFNSEHQDFSSIILYNNARRLGIPMVGICRGGQFLNVMAGGKMIQDYPGHAIHGTHPITLLGSYSGYKDGGDLEVTSTHHQVMIPNERFQTVLATAKNMAEVEIVFNDIDNSLSFQPHPEYVHRGHLCRILFFDLIEDFYGVEA